MGLAERFRRFRIMPVSRDVVRSDLWTGVDASGYAADQERYRVAILEQYRICVEMADRISARRSASNTFFLTLNTVVFGVLSAMGQGRGGTGWAQAWLLAPLLVECAAWYGLTRSYRRINEAKYLVIEELERRLPAAPYGSEWRAVGPSHQPLTSLEQWIPMIFAATYVIVFAVAITR